MFGINNGIDTISQVEDMSAAPCMGAIRVETHFQYAISAEVICGAPG